MLNSDRNDELKRKLEANIQRVAKFPNPEFREKSFLLREFINLFHDAEIQAMLQESEMQVMGQGASKWVSVVSCYIHLGKRVEDYILANSVQWSNFRDTTGVAEVEMFTRPFTDPLKCITRVNLKGLGLESLNAHITYQDGE